MEGIAAGKLGSLTGQCSLGFYGLLRLPYFDFYDGAFESLPCAFGVGKYSS